jgi:hypothetical protein
MHTHSIGSMPEEAIGRSCSMTLESSEQPTRCLSSRLGLPAAVAIARSGCRIGLRLQQLPADSYAAKPFH